MVILSESMITTQHLLNMYEYVKHECAMILLNYRVEVPLLKHTHLLSVRVNGAGSGSMLECFHSVSAGGLQCTGLRTSHAGFL